MDDRARATVAIAVVTVLTAVAATLGARASWHATTEARGEDVARTVSQRELQRVAQESARLTQANVDHLRAVLRARAAEDAAGRAAGPGAARLRRVAGEWSAVAGRFESRANAADVLATEYRPAVVARERAHRHAELADAWSSREHANGNVVALLAVALLFAGMAATGTRQRRAFVVACWVLAGVAVVRLVEIDAGAPRATSDAAIEAYAEGAVATQRGDLAAAATALRSAVRAEPGYTAAWEALGDALIAGGDARGAVEAYRRAAADAPSGALLNNLAYAELLAGDVAAAARHAADAVAALPDHLTVATTYVEVLVARGDPAARAAAERLAARFATEPATVRDALTGAWRSDAAALAGAGVAGPLKDEVFALLDRASATVAAYGTPAPREPGCRAGAPVLRYDARRYRLSFDVPCAGGAARVTVRAYRDGTHVAATLTADVRGGRATGALPVDLGTYTVATYVDGVPVSAVERELSG